MNKIYDSGHINVSSNKRESMNIQTSYYLGKIIRLYSKWRKQILMPLSNIHVRIFAVKDLLHICLLV